MVTALVVDGSLMLHRNAYICSKIGIVTWEFMSFKFMQSLIKVIRTHNPQRILVLWDKGQCTRRTKIFPDYKYSRWHDEEGNLIDPKTAVYEEQDIQYHRSVEFLHTNLPSLGITSILIPGVEADDIGFLLSRGYSTGVMVTDDKDWMLSINKGWMLHRTIKGEYVTWDDYIQTYGPNPYTRYLWEKSILGDGSDEVPGVPGLGAVNGRKFANLITDVGFPLDTFGEGRYAKHMNTHRELVLRNFKLMGLDWILHDKDIQTEVLRQVDLTEKSDTYKFLKFSSALSPYSLADYANIFSEIRRNCQLPLV